MHNDLLKSIIGSITTLGTFLWGLVIKLGFFSFNECFNLNNKDIDIIMQRCAWTLTYLVGLITIIHIIINWNSKKVKRTVKSK